MTQGEFFAQFCVAMALVIAVFFVTVMVLVRHNSLPMWAAGLMNATIYGGVGFGAFLVEGWVAMTLLAFFAAIELLNSIGEAWEAWRHPELALDH